MILFKLVNSQQIDNYMVENYESIYYTMTVENHMIHDMTLVNVQTKRGIPYLPNIYVLNAMDSSGEFEITIQTTAYGSLNEEEIKKVIDGYTTALNHVEDLRIILGLS